MVECDFLKVSNISLWKVGRVIFSTSQKEDKVVSDLGDGDEVAVAIIWAHLRFH